MLKIAFLTTVRTNVGDDFVRNGIRAVLDHTGIPHACFLVDKHDASTLHRPCEEEVEVLADKLLQTDLVIQSGAPVYWNLSNGSCSLTSEWHEWFWVNRIFRSLAPPLLNIGAGSCQPYDADERSFLKHEGCAAFARDLALRSAVTTVRDPLASAILDALQCPHLSLVCPAFLAAERSARFGRYPSLVCVNWMPLGAHYDMDGDFPEERWRRNAVSINEGLRKMGRILFVAHDAVEAEFMKGMAEPGERVFFSESWRDYLEIYGSASLIVANRVHGATAGAGFGVPAIFIGNDSRAQVADFVGLPRFRSAKFEPEELLDKVRDMSSERAAISDMLLERREHSLARYVEAVTPVMASL